MTKPKLINIPEDMITRKEGKIYVDKKWLEENGTYVGKNYVDEE